MSRENSSHIAGAVVLLLHPAPFVLLRGGDSPFWGGFHLRAIASFVGCPILSPPLRKRGINSCQDLGWWESGSISEQIAIHSVPAQHASGRGPFDRDKTLWCGWVLQSSERSIYFAGDSGYSPSFREIGQKFGGFDLAMVPIGGYEPRWLMQPMHLNPAEAVQVHIDIGSSLSVACHWGTFRMTDEPLNEPPEVLARELSARHIDPQEFRVLRVGETLEV